MEHTRKNPRSGMAAATMPTVLCAAFLVNGAMGASSSAEVLGGLRGQPPATRTLSSAEVQGRLRGRAPAEQAFSSAEVLEMLRRVGLTEEDVNPTDTPEPTETPVPESPVTSASGEASYSGRSHGKHGGRGRDDTAEYTFTAPTAETPAPVSTPAPAQEEEPESEEEGEDKEKQEDASEPAAIPTLEDYLRGLHCGGCGRNCFLLNPHCMRGARKESQAESAYYELYGEPAGDGI